jgi:hypothetical protein
MGQLKGQKEYDKFKRGEKLTRFEAIKAHCYKRKETYCIDP